MNATKEKLKFISIPTLTHVEIPEIKETIERVDPFTVPPDISFFGQKQLEAVQSASAFYTNRHVESTLRENFLLIDGAAGTGKSTAVNAVLHTFLNSHSEGGLRVCIAGLTHTAKDVLKTTCPLKVQHLAADMSKVEPYDTSVIVNFTTLHSLLNYKQKRTGLGANDISFVKDKYSNNNIEDYDIVIIDEVSMLDDTLLYDLYTHRHEVCIIIVGDGEQLPPVAKLGKSTVFSPKAQKAYKITTITLDTIYRQGSGSPLITSSQEVLKFRHTFQNRIVDKSNFVIHVNPDTTSKSEELMSFVAGQYNKDFPFKYRVITFTNSAVKAYNKGIRERIYGNPDVLEEGEYIDIIGPYNKHRKNFEYKTVCHNREQLQIIGYKYNEFTYNTIPFLIESIPYLETKVRTSSGMEVMIPLLCEECVDPLQNNIAFVQSQLQDLDKRKDAAKYKYQRFSLSVNLDRLFNLIVPFHYSNAGTTHSTQGRGYTSGVIDMKDLDICRSTNPLIYKSLLYTAITRFKKSVIFSHNSFFP